jgi:predicted HicB family RNase H-like nuclease
MTSKEDHLLEQAKHLATSARTWADLSNALFDPEDGLLTRTFPTAEARAAFVKTEQYKAIRRLLDDLVDRAGLVEGATPTKSGRFVVRLPKSLHAALEREADAEGVSLNQLVVTKLSIGLGKLTGAASK